MAYEKKPGQFSLFKNKYHEKGDTKPVMKGDGMCPCCEKVIELAVWSKQDRDGNPFFSGKIQEPRQSLPEQAMAMPPAVRVPGKASTPIDLDSEIPF